MPDNPTLNSRKRISRTNHKMMSASVSLVVAVYLILLRNHCVFAAEDTSDYPVSASTAGTPRRTFAPQTAEEDSYNPKDGSTGTTTSTTTSSSTTNTNMIVLEEASVLLSPEIDDNNFKTLVRHCLRSEDETACDGMQYWDTSRVKDMSWLFWEEPPSSSGNSGGSGSSSSSRSTSKTDWILTNGADKFNVDISGWNTTSVTTMTSMFHGAVSFDQPIGSWNVASVTDMSHM